MHSTQTSHARPIYFPKNEKNEKKEPYVKRPSSDDLKQCAGVASNEKYEYDRYGSFSIASSPIGESFMIRLQKRMNAC